MTREERGRMGAVLRTILMALAGIAGLGPRAAAQAPAVEGLVPGAADTVQATAELGVVNTTGNTDLTTVNVSQRVEWRTRRLALGQTFGMVYGRSEGETKTSEWRATIRGDVLLSGAVSGYTAVAWDRNRFAGLARRLEEGAGIAVALAKTPRDKLDLEGGVSLVQQRAIATLADDNFSAARAAARYLHHLTADAYLRQALEVIANLEATRDVRLNSETALVAPLSRRLAVKVSYVIRFDNVPEPGFESTDRLLTTALQVTF
jgi:putative salt-induced outer membrane protein